MTEWDEREDEGVSDAAPQDPTSDSDDPVSHSNDALEDTGTQIETQSGDGANDDAAADEDLHQVAATVKDEDLADSSTDAESDGQDGVPESPVEVPEEAQGEVPRTAEGIDVAEQAEPLELDAAPEDLHQVAATVEDEDLADSSTDAESDGQGEVPESPVEVEEEAQVEVPETANGIDVEEQAEPPDLDDPIAAQDVASVPEAVDELGRQDTADQEVPPVEAQQSSPETTADLDNDSEQNDQLGGQLAERSTSTGSDLAEPADIDDDDWTLDERTLPPEYYETPPDSGGLDQSDANGIPPTSDEILETPFEPGDQPSPPTEIREVEHDGRDPERLSPSEIASINDYTDAGYAPLNAALRDTQRMNGPGSSEVIRQADALSGALEKLPPSPGVTYRGLDLQASALDSYEVGQVVTEHGFTSTTLDPRVADSFGAGGNCAMVIDGSNGRDVSAFSAYPESEILFDRGTEFLVTAKEYDEQRALWIIAMKEVS